MRHPVVLRVGLSLLAFLPACSRDAAPTVDAGPACFAGPRDAAAPADASIACTPNATESARTYDFAVTEFSVDGNQTPAPSGRPISGFDLDGVATPVTRPPAAPPHCAHGDFTSALDDDQNRDANGSPCCAGTSGCVGGVDNQLPAFVDALGQFVVGADPIRELRAQIWRGDYAMLIRVSDVNGPLGPALCDPSVTVRVYRGVPLAPRCASLFERNQRYAIAAASLLTPSDPSSARFTLPGAIINGRLRVFPRRTADPAPVISLPFSFRAASVDLALFNAVLRVNLNADGTATGGNLGGIATDLNVAAVFRAALPPDLAGEWLLPFLSAFNDIAWPLDAPAATCLDVCGGGAVGIGLGFRAISAVITDTVVANPPTAPCAP